MRKQFAALCAVFLLIVVLPAAAQAVAPEAEVNVRIEGREATLFEGTIPVTIHKIEASSDTQERDCDGVNELDPGNTEPGITPTLASAEAMASIGETFDGEWYDGFGDYFITRFGPDERDNSLSAWWGILVNNVFTGVGGCQKQLDQGDEVLWIWNAFSGRPMLALYPEAAHYTEGPRPTRVAAEVDETVPLEVVSWGPGGEGTAPEVPSRTGSSPYAGASVAPVVADEKGFQRVNAASPKAVVSNAEGKADVTYDAPGIYRVKATVGAPGITETVVRSNGLEICVENEPGECSPPATGGSGEGDGEAPGGGEAGKTPTGGGPPATTPSDPSPTPSSDSTGTDRSTTVAPAASPSPARLGKVRLDRSALAAGRLKLGWRVLDPGAGLKSWRVATKASGKQGRWVSRAHGTTGTEATVRLPRGRRLRVRLIVSDVNGHSATYDLGRVTVPARH